MIYRILFSLFLFCGPIRASTNLSAKDFEQFFENESHPVDNIAGFLLDQGINFAAQYIPFVGSLLKNLESGLVAKGLKRVERETTAVKTILHKIEREKEYSIRKLNCYRSLLKTKNILPSLVVFAEHKGKFSWDPILLFPDTPVMKNLAERLQEATGKTPEQSLHAFTFSGILRKCEKYETLSDAIRNVETTKKNNQEAIASLKERKRRLLEEVTQYIELLKKEIDVLRERVRSEGTNDLKAKKALEKKIEKLLEYEKWRIDLTEQLLQISEEDIQKVQLKLLKLENETLKKK